jgi:small subunit ribosomal protein S9
MITMSAQEQRWYATGRRKRAVARVWLMPGTGKMIVNRRTEEEYFPRAVSRMIMRQPLEIVECDGKYDLLVNVKGGGISAQADAIKHGISRALCVIDSESHRAPLKKAGFLTRDAREVERKKYGQAGARKHFQFSKR